MEDLYKQKGLRKLTIHEEATIIETILNIIEEIRREPEQLCVSCNNMVNRIIRESETNI